LDYTKRTTDNFAVLFAGRDGGTNLLYEKWGWYLSLWALSGEDITKMNAITELPIGVTLQHLAFLKDLEADRKNGIK
jgi:hypothetical protein